MVPVCVHFSGNGICYEVLLSYRIMRKGQKLSKCSTFYLHIAMVSRKDSQIGLTAIVYFRLRARIHRDVHNPAGYFDTVHEKSLQQALICSGPSVLRFLFSKYIDKERVA